MKSLTKIEQDEIINLASTTAENYIFNNINKKDIEDIEINVEINAPPNKLDIDISIGIDTDLELPTNLSNNAINASIEAVDNYMENREK